MKMCTKMLASAVMSVSLCTAAWAQSSTAGQSPTDPSTGSQTGGSGASSGSMTGGSSTGGSSTGSSSAGGSATGGSSTGGSSGDALGSSSSAQSRDMQRGAMGSDADQKMSAQLDKIASMPDKAADALFVLDAAKSNLFEVEFARVAQQKSQNQQVKDLAKMIEQDHGQANEKLRPIAQKMGLELPSSLPSEKQKMLTVFQAMKAEDFDTCFILDNKAAHAKSITSYADHQKSVKDEGLRGYISAALPKLQQHGQHVQQLASSQGFPTPMGGGGASGGHGAHGSMSGDTSRSISGGASGGASGASDPSSPANSQNPSNR